MPYAIFTVYQSFYNYKQSHISHISRYTILSALWCPRFLALLHFKHHLWSHAHTHTHTQLHREITERLLHNNCSWFTHAYTQAHTICQRAVVCWLWPCHNLSLIIYTARFTVLMQRPEKIQPTNLICTQQQ